MYLQEAVKDGPARFVIQGLTRTSKIYEKVIRCLKERYDDLYASFKRKTSACSIVDAVPVKNGSDKEIRHLYNGATQHYQALHVNPCSKNLFILNTADSDTAAEIGSKTRLKWAKFNSDSTNIPPCTCRTP